MPHCPQCHRKFRDRKALLCHMNHPFGSCHSHLEEVANLVDELHRYRERRRQHQPLPSPSTGRDNFIPSTIPEPMDIDATPVEDFREDVQNVDSGPFIQEYVGAAREYGRGTTFLQRFDSDQHAQACKKISIIHSPHGMNGS
jgi:hypothetical protein